MPNRRLPSRALLVAGLSLALAPAGALGQAQPRIVGGADAPAGTYDAVANITFVSFGCSGTLISPQWVLTAGHCGSVTGEATGSPIDWPASSYKLTLGTTDANGSDGNNYSVDRLTHPPQYLATSGYDVTLLHLTKAAAEQPVKIAGKGAEGLWKPNVLETIAGFGVDEKGNQPPKMQVAQVPIVDDQTCAKAYPNDPSSPVYPTYFEPTSQICAGYAKGGTDTCQGDSGGPLFGHDALGSLKVVGATSYGNGCAEAGYPGVYARVADTTLREWIRTVAPDAIDDTVVLSPLGAPPAAPPPAPSPSAGTGSSGAPAAGAPAASARFAIDVPKAARKAVRRTGLAVGVTCPAACTTKLTLRVDSRTRRKLKLRSAIVGRASLTVPPRVRGTATIRLARRAAPKILGMRGAKLTVTAQFAAPGGEHASARKPVRLSGKTKA